MRKLKVKEKDIQNAILAWLNYNGFFCWPMQNQGQYDPIKKIYRKPPKWFVYGVPDIMVAMQYGIVLFIEVKTPVGKLSEHQQQFKARLGALGHKYVVAKSVEDVAMFMGKMGYVNPNKMRLIGGTSD